MKEGFLPSQDARRSYGFRAYHVGHGGVLLSIKGGRLYSNQGPLKNAIRAGWGAGKYKIRKVACIELVTEEHTYTLGRGRSAKFEEIES